MHPTSNVRRRLAAGVLALSGLAGAAPAVQPPAPPAGNQPGGFVGEVKVDARTGALLVPAGARAKFTPKAMQPIRDISVRNSDVVDARVDVDSPESIILVGQQNGATQIIVTVGTKDSEVKVAYDVVVQPDFELLNSVIRRTVPTATVEVIPGPKNAVVLSGFVSKPEDSDTVLRIAADAVGPNAGNLINALQVGGSQHVLIDVVVAQVNRTELRNRGFSFGISGSNFAFASVVSPPGGTGGTGANAITNLITGRLSTPALAGAASNISFGFVPSNFIGALQALRTENLAKFLTEPKVVTQTGRPAFFRAGGQQAVLGPASGINGPGAVLQPFGTEVEVLPIVLGNGKIYLEINPRVSSVNFGLGIATAFGNTPGFSEQQTRASVTLESGQTFAIGGLIETQVQAAATKVPVLGDIPYLGTVFSGVTHQEVENEVVILVTPRLVEPMDCNQVPRRLPGMETRTPDDYELFLEGLLEAPRGQRQVWTGKKYNAAYKCDPTYGKYPCIGPLCVGGYSGCLPAGGPAVAAPAGAVLVPAGGTAVTPVGGTAPAQPPAADLPPVASPPAEAAVPVPAPVQ